MRRLGIYKLLGKRVLVTRASARAVGPELASALAQGEGKLELDFSGVKGVAPSFLDEILAIIEDGLRVMAKGQFQVLVVNPPTRLSSNMEAIGRVRGLSIKEWEGGAWIVTVERQQIA